MKRTSLGLLVPKLRRVPPLALLLPRVLLLIEHIAKETLKGDGETSSIQKDGEQSEGE